MDVLDKCRLLVIKYLPDLLVFTKLLILTNYPLLETEEFAKQYIKLIRIYSITDCFKLRFWDLWDPTFIISQMEEIRNIEYMRGDQFGKPEVVRECSINLYFISAEFKVNIVEYNFDIQSYGWKQSSDFL